MRLERGSRISRLGPRCSVQLQGRTAWIEKARRIRRGPNRAREEFLRVANPLLKSSESCAETRIAAVRRLIPRLLRVARQSVAFLLEIRQRTGPDCCSRRSRALPFTPRSPYRMNHGVQKSWILLFQAPQFIDREEASWLRDRHNLVSQNRWSTVPGPLSSPNQSRQTQHKPPHRHLPHT